MEKKFQFFRKLMFLTLLMLGVGSAFGMDSWIDHKSSTAPGIVGDCYQIKSAGDLAWYANFVNGQGEHAESCAELKSDIDLNGNFWVPISFKGKRHKVNFNGNGYIIKNLYISAEELLNKYTDTQAAQNLGLIGAFEGHVQNVILENVEVYGYGKNYTTGGADPVKNPLSIGTVVGWQTTDGSIVENCYVTGKMVTSGDGQAVGGIVGNNGGGTIRNCYSAVNIDASGTSYVGGIAGYTKAYQNGSATISSCVYDGDILSSSGAGEAGAIVGNHLDGTTTFENCYYDNTKFNKGVGETMGGTTTGSTTGAPDLNSELVISTLNSGAGEGHWSAGETSVSLNDYGADGHKITFSANGGSFAGVTTGVTTFVKYVQHGNIINNDGVADPVWATDDFVFAGWSGEAYNKAATKATTITASWNKMHTITFSPVNGDLQGTFPDGSSDPVSIRIEDGKRIVVQGFDRPTTFTDANGKYNFVGWAFAESPTTALVETGTGLDNLPLATRDTTLVAVWTTAPVYTVSFYANGSTTASYVSTVYQNEKATELTVDKMDPHPGYTFKGWFESGAETSFDFTQIITADVDLYAKWEKNSYTVEYVLNCSNECSNSNADEFTVDGMPLSDPEWNESHRFLGWYKDSEFKNKVTSIPAGSTGNLTLYAEWEDVTYTITYRGGTYGIGLVPSETKIHGQNYTLRDASYTRKGYVQTGWSTTDEGTDFITFGSSYSENANLILYPTWAIVTYTINYVCEVCNESNPSTPRTYTVNDTKNANLPIYNPAFSSAEYIFKGWYSENTYTNKKTNIPKDTVGDITLYGKMLKYYKISYELNGKNVKANNTERYHVEFYVELKAPDPATIDGYTFAGWYDNAEFSGEPVTEIPLGSTGDRKFYAKWTPITYTITYVIDGEENAIEAGSFTVEGAVTLPTPTKDQYTFDGWYETEALTGDKVTGFDAGTYKTDKTFYAKWDKVYPFVTQYAAVTVTENADGTKTATVNDGYTAAGTVNIPTPIEIDNIVINRTFSAGTPGTIMLPFTLPSVTTFNNAKFYYLQKVEQITNKKAWKATMKWIGEGNLPEANKPYGVICQNTTLEINLNGDKATLQTSESGAGVNIEETGNWYSDETVNWRFVGVYAYKHWTKTEDEVKDGLAYALAGSAGNGLKAGDFGRVSEGNEIYPMRSYMRKKDVSVQLVDVGPQAIRARGASYGLNNIGSEIIEVEFVDDEKTTAIGHMNTVTGEIKIDRWFDLKGRSVKNVNRAAKGAYYGKKGFHE